MRERTGHLRSFSLARVHFFVVDGKLLKIVSFKDVAAVEAGHVFDSITPHQKLGALMFTARHSKVRIITILITAVTLSSPFFAGSRVGPTGF